MPTVRNAILLAAALGLFACPPKTSGPRESTGGPFSQPASNQAAEEAAAPEPPLFVRQAPLDTLVTPPPDARAIAKLYLLGDSQIRYLMGKRSFAQAGWVDRKVEVSVRPVHLDLSSDLLLDEFLRFRAREYADSFFVYLGDAADISCRQELTRFFEVMGARGYKTPDALGESWAIVTSNHDGFFVGNFTQRDDGDGALKYTDMPEDWYRACSDPGLRTDQILTKGRFIEQAVKLLRDDLLAGDLEYDIRSADSNNSYYTDHLYYARRLDDGSSPSVVVYGLFLDTVDYRKETNLTRELGAGVVGALSKEQIDFVRKIIARKASEHPGKTIYYALFGHHSIEMWTKKSREELGGALLPVARQLIGYFGAHEHASRIGTAYLGPIPVREVITGSTLDWPQEGRTVELLWSESEQAIALKTQIVGVDPTHCTTLPRLYDGSFSYTGYRELREEPPSAIGVAWNELWGDYQIRKKTLLSALKIENLQVRQLARLYLLLPVAEALFSKEDTELLKEIEKKSYARAEDDAGLVKLASQDGYFSGLSEYELWFDPKTLPDSAALYGATHSFGRYRDLFLRLAPLRWQDALRPYFICHALAASEAEAKERIPRQGVYLVR